MTNLSHTELSEICIHLKETKPKNITRIYGGHIHNSWKIDFPQDSIFVKKNSRDKKFLKFENQCLKDLRKFINPANLVLPEVLGYLEINNIELLLMEWIDMKSNLQTKLGKGLAEMHLNSYQNHPKSFGYSLKGFIGTSNQIEGWEYNWADSFIKLRLEPQFKNLKDKDLNKNIINKLKSKIKNILLEHTPYNSLVHGDLWSGNIGISNLNKGVIFDPASWWADCEVDIAMSRLFGGFNYEFYEEYYKILPRQEGYKKRTIIYNLYHVLNHANMFGGMYLQQVYDYIKEILEM